MFVVLILFALVMCGAMYASTAFGVVAFLALASVAFTAFLIGAALLASAFGKR